LVGSIRPGDRVSAGSPFFLVTWVPVVLVVDRVDLARVVVRAAGRDHGGGQLADRLVSGDHAVVGGAVVVLHLLDRDDVGRGQVGDDALG
jgi:hypothetical protein